MNRSGTIRRILLPALIPLWCLAVSVAAFAGEGMKAVLDSLSRDPLPELYAKGENDFMQGRYDAALNVFTIICKGHTPTASREDQEIYAGSYDRYGNILYKKGAYSLAMDSYLKGRRIAEQNRLIPLLARIYANIGNLYASSGDFDSALTFYTRSLSLDVDNDYLHSMLLNNILMIHLKRNELDQARHWFERYRREGKRDSRYDFDICVINGLLRQKVGRNDSAMMYFRRGLDLARDMVDDPLCEATAYSHIAACFEDAGRIDSAIVYNLVTERMLRNEGNRRLIVEIWRDLSRQYEKKNLRDSALDYKSRCLELADSISYQEDFSKLKTSQMLYELDENATTIKDLNDERRTHLQLLGIVSGVAVVFILFIFLLRRQNRKLRAAWTDLYEKNSRQLHDEQTYRLKIAQLEKRLDDLQGNDDVSVGLSDPAKDGGEECSSAEGAGNEESTRKALLGERQRDKIARDILEVMENTEDYCSPDFSLDRLAASIDSNPRYVSEVINEVFQKNFRAMLNEYRVKKAMVRLSDTANYGNLTIKAISESVGYRSQATFITVFTRQTGLKPSLYQKLARENGGQA